MGILGDLTKAEATIGIANDLRATNSLPPLSLDSNMLGDCSPVENRFDFPRFGPKHAQDRMRLGLSKIPALNLQVWLVSAVTDTSGKTFDSPVGEWIYTSTRGQIASCT